VWAATGIWHGASWNFLFWGLYYGVLLVLEKMVWGKKLAQTPAFVQHIYTLFLVVIGWALFAVEDLGQLVPYLKGMFGLGGAGLADTASLYYLGSFFPMLVILTVASTPLAANLWKKLPKKGAQVVLPVLLMLGLLLSTAYLVDATYNPFLYFRF